MTTIELGEIGSSPGYEPDPGTDRRLVRRVGLLVVLSLLLFGVAASGLPEQPGLRPLWSVPMAEPDGMMLSADTAYLSRTTDGRTRVTAYDLATGDVRWERALDTAAGDTQLWGAAGLILVSADRQATLTESMFLEFHRTTIALDARTGERLWTAPGQAMTVSGDSALMAYFDDHGMIERYRLLRLADLSPVWTRSAAVYTYSFAEDDGRPDRIVTTTLDGTVEVVRLADGAVVARARIRWVDPKPEQNQFDDVTVNGDYLVVNRNRQERADISVYRLDDLSEVWRADNTRGYAFVCGVALCTNNGEDLAAYDLRSGRRLWAWPGVGNGWVASPDRLVVDEGGAGSLFLIDTATGAPVGDRVRGTTVWSLDPDGAVYLTKPTADPPGRTSITKWDLGTGRSRLLGSLAALVGYRCQLENHFLACQRPERFEVTAVD